jgi:hypothetical protein
MMATVKDDDYVGDDDYATAIVMMVILLVKIMRTSGMEG